MQIQREEAPAFPLSAQADSRYAGFMMPKVSTLPDRTYPSDTQARKQLLPAGMSHPAKLMLGLQSDLIRRYTKPHHVLLDPFAGIGGLLLATVMDDGPRHVILCELERKFCEAAQQNYEHLQQQRALGTQVGQALIIQADSRHLPLRSADIACGSPPYATRARDELGIRVRREDGDGHGVFRPDHFDGNASSLLNQRYGDSPHQIGNLPRGDVSACIGSPPYADLASRSRSTEPYAQQHPEREREYGGSPSRHVDGYGESVGQIGMLPQGEIATVLGSPPYADSAHKPGNLEAMREKLEELYPGHVGPNSLRNATEYGEGVQQIGNLLHGEVAAAIGSPPYSESLSYQRPGAGGEQWELLRAGYTPEQIAELRRTGDSRVLEVRQEAGYSREAGNIGNLPHGQVDAAVGSPPFGEMNSPSAGGWITQRPAKDGQGFEGDRDHFVYTEESGTNIGNLPYGGVDVAAGSPPYADSIHATGHGIDWTKAGPATGNRQRGIGTKHEETLCAQLAYSAETPGQIGNLPHGQVDVAAGSPPYAGSEAVDNRQTLNSTIGHHGGGLSARLAYGQSPQQIAQLPHDSPSVVLSSPPYERAITQGGETSAWRDKYGYQGDNDGYSRGDKNIGNLASHAMELSDLLALPVEERAEAHARALLSDPTLPDWDRGWIEWGLAQKQQKLQSKDSASLKGEPPTETYAAAVFKVYRECYRVVKHGGLLLLVTGNYIRDGKEIDLAADTIKLAEVAGWTLIERWKHRKSRLSFWRLLHAKKRPEVPVVMSEDVLCFSKGPPAWEFADLPPTMIAPVQLAAQKSAPMVTQQSLFDAV